MVWKKWSPTRIVAGVITGLLVSINTMICWGQGADVLDLVQAGSKNAAQAIQSGKGTITVHTWDNKGGPGGAVTEREMIYKVAFRGNKYRVSTEATMLRNDPQPNMDNTLILTPVGAKENAEACISGTDVVYVTGSRAWVGKTTTRRAGGHWRTLYRDVMLADPTVGTECKGVIDLSELEITRNPKPGFTATPTVTGIERVGGSECIVVQIVISPSAIEQATQIYKIWVDPQKGYTIPRLCKYLEGGRYSTRVLNMSESVVLKEYGNGVWFPASVSREYYANTGGGESYKTSEVNITYAHDFEVNVPVGDSELSLKLPSGTTVMNETVDGAY